MNFLNYSLAAFGSFMGLIAGIIVIFMAKEEQTEGKKYFITLQRIILFLVIIFLLYFLKLNLIIFLIVALIGAILYIERFKNKALVESYFIYPILGVIFFLSSKKDSLLLIESSLIFLYGIVSVSLLFNRKKTNTFQLIMYHSSYLISSIVLFILPLCCS